MAQTYKLAAGVAYGQSDAALLFKDLLGDGVMFGQLNELVVTANASGMQVFVNTGRAFVQGFWYQSDTSVTLAIAAADPTNPRIDRVVLRADTSGAAVVVSLVVKTGTPGASPSPPAITQSGTTWELGLAQVRVGNGVANIAADRITDERYSQAGSAGARMGRPVGRSQSGIEPIINGGMQVYQENINKFSMADATYMADGWVYLKAGTTEVRDGVQETSVVPGLVNGVYYDRALKFAVTAADAAVAAGDRSSFEQRMQGYRFAASVKQRQFTLQFLVYSAVKTGIMNVYFKNSGSDRTYVAEVNIVNASTWELKTVTVPASPSAGTWSYTTGIGLRVGFAFMAGSTFQTTAGAWQTGDFYGSANGANWGDNVANTVYISGVQIDPGPEALPYRPVPFSVDLLECRDFWRSSYASGTFPGNATQSGARYLIASDNITSKHVAMDTRFDPPMAAAPAITLYDGAGNSGKITTLSAAEAATDNVVPTTASALITDRSFVTSHTGTIAGIVFHYVANSRL